MLAQQVGAAADPAIEPVAPVPAAADGSPCPSATSCWPGWRT